MEGKTSTIPLIRTKLQRPPIVGNHVHRLRLLERLDQRRQRPLTLISAPAGYGKSTLMSCWLGSRDIPVAWLSLDENDNDLHRFLSYVLAAVRTIFPGAGKDIETILDGPDLPPMSILSSTLINELDLISQACIFAFDDFHVIHNEDIHLVFIEILKHPPRNLHLAISSRVDPPLPLTTMRAKGEMNEIRVQDLRFTNEETAQYLEQMTEKKIERQTITLIDNKMEGWVTGLRLAAISLRHREDAGGLWSDLPNDSRYVMDYMVAEVLSHLPPVMKQNLLKTSILNRFSAPLCQAVFGTEIKSASDDLSGNEFMDWLVQSNLFLIHLDDEHVWYRYHHLFQDLLKRLLHERMSSEEIDAVHKKAGTWFAENGLVEEAIHHFVAGGDAQSAAIIVMRHRMEVMNEERWRGLERWLYMLPDDSIEKNPELLVTKAWLSEIRIRFAEMNTLLKKFEFFIDTPPAMDESEWEFLLAEFKVLKALLLYYGGDGPGTVTNAHWAIGRLNPQAISLKSVCLMILAGGYQMQGQLMKAYAVVENALKEKVPYGTTYHSRLFSTLCFINWIAADLTGLRQAAQQVLKIGRDFNLSQSFAWAYYFLGIIHYHRGELADAEEQLRFAVQDRFIANTVNYCHSTFALALCLEAQSRSSDASEITERIIGHALESRNGELLKISQAFQAELALRQGNLPEAERWAQNYDPYPFNSGHRFYVPQLTLVKVLLALKTKQSQNQATDLLTSLYDYFSSVHNTRFIIDVLALQAILYKVKGDSNTALSLLERAITLAEPGGFVRPFLDMGLEIADLLNRIVKRKTDVSFVGKILKFFREEKIIHDQSSIHGSRFPATVSAANDDIMENLTKRELSIAALLVRRLSNQEIADELYISPETVKRHLYNIYRKLHVSTRREAARKITALGII